MRKLINLDERKDYWVSLLHFVVFSGALLHAHLLIQAGVNVDIFTVRDGKSLFTRLILSHVPHNIELSLMLLFAGANPKEKKFVEKAKPQARKWLNGFLKAKEMFQHIFEDPD